MSGSRVTRVEYVDPVKPDGTLSKVDSATGAGRVTPMSEQSVVWVLWEKGSRIGNPYLLGIYGNEDAALQDLIDMGGEGKGYSVQGIALDHEPVVRT